MARILIIAVTALVLSSLSQAQQQLNHPPTHGALELSSFSVTVTTSSGAPAENARVELRDVVTGQLVTSGYTNASGALELPGIQPTTYLLDVTHGLSEFKEKADMRMGDRTMAVRLPGGEDSGNIESKSTVSVAQYKVPSKARNEYKKADEALHKGKKEECAQHLAKALDIYANFAEALTLRGILNLDGQNPAKAVADIESAIKADPTYGFAYIALGATYNNLSRFDDAIRTLDRGVSFSPNAWQGYFEMAKARLGKGEFQSALRQLDKAQSLVREAYPAIHLAKAHALLALKQYPDAMNELQAFLAAAPNDARSSDARQALEQMKAYVGK
ncbi:MAG: repeat protein [Candidatus Angelobacter sp.]|jgi:lipopolysaccharide biosynthesis regulator YciM|nr:repeat protein [Candidatus Angelobacter sp.]